MINHNKLEIGNQMKPSNYQTKNDIRKKIEDYSYGLSDVIGKGVKSIVFRGINQKHNKKQPQKSQILNQLNKISLKDNYFKVKFNLLGLQIIQIFQNALMFIFCNEGDLDNLLKCRGKLQQRQVIPLFRDIFLGVKYLQQNSYIHRDLKPSNIFIKQGQVKIGDFGFCKKQVNNSLQKYTHNVDSLPYMAPQSLYRNIFTNKTDIWSLGIILYQMLHGKTPWQSNNQKQLIQRINSIGLYFIKNLSEDIKDFFKQCLTVDEDKRISFQSICIHPFITRIVIQGDIPKFLRKLTSIEHPKQNVSKENQIKKQQVISKTQKEIQSQINWMRFLFRLNEMFPCVSKSNKFTIGLRFIIVKQMLCQVYTLKDSIFQKQNYFGFYNWTEFYSATQKVKKYQHLILDYIKKYKNLKLLLQDWIKIVDLDQRLTLTADNNFKRSENLSILGIKYCFEQIKTLWDQVKREADKNLVEQLGDQLQKKALRVDFLMTYYQLNCLLVDNFHDADYFARVSKIQLVNEYKPSQLQKSNLQDIQNKLDLLGLYL